MRLKIWVKPGSRRESIGGSHDGALVVAVTARAVDGAATDAALKAVAAAFGVRRADVNLVAGATSRTKWLDVTGATQEMLDALLGGS